MEYAPVHEMLRCAPTRGADIWGNVRRGLVGALLLVVGAVLLIDADGDSEKRGQKPTSAPVTSARQLPAGVKCAGEDCDGQDPQAIGCGAAATTTADVTVGTAYVGVSAGEGSPSGGIRKQGEWAGGIGAGAVRAPHGCGTGRPPALPLLAGGRQSARGRNAR